MRLIDADALMEYVDREYKNQKIDLSEFGTLVYHLNMGVSPTVDAEPVRHGKWITKSNPNYSPFDPCSSEELHICNQCGYEQEFGTNYCPDCGAKMNGERREE